MQIVDGVEPPPEQASSSVAVAVLGRGTFPTVEYLTIIIGITFTGGEVSEENTSVYNNKPVSHLKTKCIVKV